VDVHEKLDELVAQVESARSMPMSASCIVNRGEMLALLDEVRALLPEELAHAEQLLRDREAVIDEGRAEADRILGDARDEQKTIVSQSEIVRIAELQADQIRTAATDEAASMRAEVDDYVDAKLANFEVVLNKTLNAVHRGREKLRGRSDVGGLGDFAPDDTPLPS
jgi:cell division septum initiation protein DivIVA